MASWFKITWFLSQIAIISIGWSVSIANRVWYTVCHWLVEVGLVSISCTACSLKLKLWTFQCAQDYGSNPILPSVWWFTIDIDYIMLYYAKTTSITTSYSYWCSFSRSLSVQVLRWVFQLILAQWRSQRIKYRLRLCFNLKSCLSDRQSIQETSKYHFEITSKVYWM